MTPRRVEVEVGVLVVEGRTVARQVELAGALARELGRLVAEGDHEGERFAAQIGEAVARSLGGELAR